MSLRKLILLIFILCISCGDEQQPKPRGFLDLDYPKPSYEVFDDNCPFIFEKNKIAAVTKPNPNRDCWLNLNYELLQGTIFITYQEVNGNLDSLLVDAQKLPLQHTIKADAIEGDTYLNPHSNTYGMFYEVSGDAASQAQFYLTDSVRHFITGSVYFEARPNFDSVLPAAAYLKEDIRHLMETVRWEGSF